MPFLVTCRLYSLQITWFPMVYKLTIPTLVLTTMLTACGGSDSNNTSASKNVIDASSATSVVSLGSNYSLHFSVKSLAAGTDKNVNIDITQYGNNLKSSGSFAQVHGVPERNYKTQSDADITFSVTATDSAGKTFNVENFDIYYENFNSTSTLKSLLLQKLKTT